MAFVHRLRFVVAGAVLLASAVPSASAQGHRRQVAQVSTTEGPALYNAWCLPCHGPRGHGNGPEAPRLGVRVPSIALLAERDGGFRPTDFRMRLLDHRRHKEMPDWDAVLLRNYRGQRALIELAIHNLTLHVEKMQIHPERH